MRATVDTGNSATFTVTTGTVLLNWTYIPSLDAGIFAVRNLDAVNNLSLLVERSGPDNTHTETLYTLAIPPASMRALTTSSDLVGFWVRLTALSDSPAFPSVQGQWRRVTLRQA